MGKTVEFNKEQLLEIIDIELKEVNKRNNNGDREIFIDKLENTRDFVKHAKTDEEIEKVFNSKFVQVILKDYVNKNVYK